MENQTEQRSDRLLGRRDFLGGVARGGAVAGVTTLLGNLSASTPDGRVKTKGRPAATADSCIFVWLPGGMCHVDTLDPKPKGNGKDVPGGYYNPIKTAVSGIEVCEHLPQLAERMDRLAIVRSLHHQFSNHTQAVDFVHTGRLPSGTVVYPSLGSVVARELGGLDPQAPPYVVIGYPMQPRGPGFLGGENSYVYVTDVEAGPAVLQVPRGTSPAEYADRVAVLKEFSQIGFEEHPGSATGKAYASTMSKAFEMMSEKFQHAFSVKDERADLREAYGEEFGQRLLLSRRLVENGIRFVECSFNLHFINGYGWDTHAFAQERVHLLIRQLDRGLSVLIEDLDRRGMFDRTLVVVATEFGRPPEFDGQGGRGHHSKAFSAILFGGGVGGGRVIGATDHLGREIVDRPISIPDFHATIHRALGIDPDKHLITPDSRPVPITDFGKPVEEFFA